MTNKSRWIDREIAHANTDPSVDVCFGQYKKLLEALKTAREALGTCGAAIEIDSNGVTRTRLFHDSQKIEIAANAIDALGELDI